MKDIKWYWAFILIMIAMILWYLITVDAFGLYKN